MSFFGPAITHCATVSADAVNVASAFFHGEPNHLPIGPHPPPMSLNISMPVWLMRNRPSRASNVKRLRICRSGKLPNRKAFCATITPLSRSLLTICGALTVPERKFCAMQVCARVAISFGVPGVWCLLSPGGDNPSADKVGNHFFTPGMFPFASDKPAQFPQS